MTAEGPTGAPLRQQIAEAIHTKCADHNEVPLAECEFYRDHEDASDAVVALLGESGRPFIYGDRVKSVDTCLHRRPRVKVGWWNVQDGCWSSYDDEGIRSEMRSGRMRLLNDDESSETFRED